MLPVIEKEYDEKKQQLQELSRAWEALVPDFCAVHDKRMHWRRLERRSMQRMQLDVSMLPGSESEDEHVQGLVAASRSSHQDDPEDAAMLESDSAHAVGMDPEGEEQEVGSELDEDPHDAVTTMYMSRPAMFTVNHRQCCERIYRLQRRRYDEDPEKKKKKLADTLAALAELDAHADAQHVPVPSMAPRVTSASRSSNQPKSPNQQHRPLVPGLQAKEKTKKLAADARGAYLE